MARIFEGLGSFQAQAFPSWQSDGAFGPGAQSGAAPAACGHRPKADVRGSDGKAAGWVGRLVVGVADVR